MTVILFQLGEHYLILAEEKDKELNNRLAVDWLIKAAKQGRKGAARLLQRCWIQEKGSRVGCTLRHACVFVFVLHICLFLFSRRQESRQRMKLMFAGCRQKANLSWQCEKPP